MCQQGRWPQRRDGLEGPTSHQLKKGTSEGGGGGGRGYCEIHTSGFIRVWKLLPSRCILKTLVPPILTKRTISASSGLGLKTLEGEPNNIC